VSYKTAEARRFSSSKAGEGRRNVNTVFTTTNGKHIPLLDISSVVETEDGSVEVSYGSETTRLTGQNAHEFKLATSSPYRAQQESEATSKTVLELWREGALG
jgi:hypothetical protein